MLVMIFPSKDLHSFLSVLNPQETPSRPGLTGLNSPHYSDFLILLQHSVNYSFGLQDAVAHGDFKAWFDSDRSSRSRVTRRALSHVGACGTGTAGAYNGCWVGRCVQEI
jgi:hypothetical protein